MRFTARSRAKPRSRKSSAGGEGRFYFEEGIISQVQTVDRPWEHLLIDNLQKLDETLGLVSLPAKA